MRIAASLIIAAALSFPVAAEVVVEFDEGAPKDRFTITNSGECDLGASSLSIDLSPSPYGLIFDVSGSGAGVEVYQPLEFTSGQRLLAAVPKVRDGDNRVELALLELNVGASVSFTIDIDDTANSRQTVVANAEISEAVAILRTGSSATRASFGNDAVASIPTPGCAG